MSITALWDEDVPYQESILLTSSFEKLKNTFIDN
jgi:hypothetical protein